MTTSPRILLVAASIVAAHMAVRTAGQYFALLPAVGAEQDLAQTIPLNLQSDHWRGTDVPLAPDVLSILGADVVVNRDYLSPIGETVGVNVAVFRDYSLSPPHPPLVCYPADGWTLQNTEYVAINRDDSTSPKVALYSFERQGEQSLVMFWMDLGGPLAFDRDGIRSVLRGLRPRSNQPLLKKVMLHTTVDSPERARLRLQGMAAPLFQATAAYR